MHLSSLRGLSFAALLFVASAFHAAAALTTACVNTPSLLQSALTAAQSNNDDNYIQVVTGSYGFGAAFVVSIPPGHALTVEGGYSAGCASAPNAIPYSTLFKGTLGASLQITVADGALTLRNLTLSGFQPPAGTRAISLVQNGYYSTLHVENVNVNSIVVASGTDDILYVYSQGGLTFDDNIVHDNANANSAVHIGGLFSALPVVVANNTVTHNAGHGLLFDAQTLLPSGLYNNILWSNGNFDLIVAGTFVGTPPLALNNIWLNCSGCAGLAAVSANNSSEDPLLTANYQPGNGSPAVNSGVPLPLVLPATDALAAARVVGSAPDRGAFESTTDDFSSHTYVVSDSGDDPGNVQTLRGAISAANAAGVPARIKLDSSVNGCPMEIDLATPLPAIAVPMLIDAYDSNSVVNTAAKRGFVIPFNATLCTLLYNTGSATNSAFTLAPSAPASQHLEVRGVRFSHFGTAVNLGGGNGHWIHGNAFSLSDGSLGNGIGVGIGGGQFDVVGGPAVADVNLIGSSTGIAAVLVQGASGFHTIVNNSIGADPAADPNTTTYANAQSGVEFLDASRDTITGNAIFYSGVNGVYLDNASYSVVSLNGIGFGGGAASTPGNVSGVRAGSGAFDNFIGATAGNGHFEDAAGNTTGNVIGYTSGPGVWIDPSAGIYNQVAGNFMGFNTGLAIDLALKGPTANVGTESSGPNDMLHKPTLAGALEVGGNTVEVTGTITTEAPNTQRYLTVYQSSNCDDAATILGTFLVQSGADSIAHFRVTAVYSGSSQPIYINANDDDVTAAGISETSEISNSRMIKPGDDVFYDGFDCH